MSALIDLLSRLQKRPDDFESAKRLLDYSSDDLLSARSADDIANILSSVISEIIPEHRCLKKVGKTERDCISQEAEDVLLKILGLNLFNDSQISNFFANDLLSIYYFKLCERAGFEKNIALVEFQRRVGTFCSQPTFKELRLTSKQSKTEERKYADQFIKFARALNKRDLERLADPRLKESIFTYRPTHVTTSAGCMFRGVNLTSLTQLALDVNRPVFISTDPWYSRAFSYGLENEGERGAPFLLIIRVPINIELWEMDDGWLLPLNTHLEIVNVQYGKTKSDLPMTYITCDLLIYNNKQMQYMSQWLLKEMNKDNTDILKASLAFQKYIMSGAAPKYMYSEESRKFQKIF